jgi:hypothetical protein
MVYLQLFHGRKTPDEQMSGWGTEGPVLGPQFGWFRFKRLATNVANFQSELPLSHSSLAQDLSSWDKINQL